MHLSISLYMGNVVSLKNVASLKSFVNAAGNPEQVPKVSEIMRFICYKSSFRVLYYLRKRQVK